MSLTDKLDKINNFLEKSRDEIISLQKLLISIPAVGPDSGGDGEMKKALALEKWLRSKGFSDIIYYNSFDPDVSDGVRPNMVLTIPGEKNDKTFWIMSHLDIVPPGEISLWESDPYTAVIKNNRIYGRGAEDNQQGLTASVFAAMALAENNIIPEYTVKLLFAADEETGSKHGIDYILENHNLFGKEDFVLVPDAGNPEGTMVEVAEKNILWLKIITKGKQCHASRPDLGINAFTASSDMVMRLAELDGTLGDYNKIFEPPRTTLTPTKKDANVPNVNTLPGEDVFYLDCRVLPETGLDKIMEEISKIKNDVEKKYGVKISFESVQSTVSKPTPEDCRLVSLVKTAVKHVYGKETRITGIGGGTVAGYLRNKDIETVVWGKIDETAHMPDEYCSIENLTGDAAVMACLMAGCR